jgi:hypothetical protein
VTDVLLADQSDAIRIWALKAARFVLPWVVQAGMAQNQQKLLASIKAHADNPILVALVYEALSMNYQSKVNFPGREKIIAAGVNEVLGLLGKRVALYQKQIPPEPLGDVPATVFLSSTATWNTLPPAVQLQVVQTLSDLTVLAGQRAAAANGAPRTELETVVQKTASALGAIALISKAQDVFNKLQPLIKLNPGTSNPNLLQLVTDVPRTLQNVSSWAKIKPPPAINAAGPATAPSTAPSTAPAVVAKPK